MKPHRQRGFSLVELMIALLLGLMVIGGVTSVFLSNKQSYRTNNALSQVQEGSRIAFELLARDIRQAGLSACGNSRVANTLNNPSACWWCGFNNAVRGYEGDETSAVAFGGTAGRVNGTDAVQLMGVADSGLSITNHQPASAGLFISATTTNLAPGDIVMVCDPDHTTIMQITNYNSANVRVNHNEGGARTPGNCTNSVNFPTDCSTQCNMSGGGNCYSYGANSQIARMTAVEWYIGNNPLGGTSLYQLTLGSSGGNAVTTAQEMVRNVTDMQLEYLFNGQYMDADDTNLTDWAGVSGVRVTLALQGAENFTGTDGERIERDFTASVTIRNRVN